MKKAIFSLCALVALSASAATQTVPYTSNFDDDFDQWTTVDANEDENTWQLYTLNWAKITGAYFMSTNFPGDDWLISQPIEFEPSSTYKITIVGIGNKHPLTYYLLKDSDTANPVQEIGSMTMQSNWAVNSHELQFTTGDEAGALNLAIHEGASKGDSFIVIDRIDIEKIANNNLAATAVTGNIKPIEGKTYSYTVSVTNKGGLAYNSFDIQLVDADGNVLASNSFNEEILPTESKNFTIDYTIPMGCTLSAIYGRVKAEGDEIEADDTTPALEITVLPKGSPEELAIGTKESTSNYHPMNLYSKYGASLNIYSADELTIKEGNITGIKYEYSSSYYTATNVGIKVYLANTDRTNNDEGWIPEAELTLVYDGHFDLSTGTNFLELTFDNAFAYTGSNLALFTQTSMAEADRSYISGVYQPYYTSPLPGNQVIVYGNDRTEFDFATSNFTKRTGNSVITLMVQTPEPAVEATGIKLNAIVGKVGENIEISALVEPADATDKTINWSSSNPEVAAVDAEGTVWFNAEGNAVVSGECQGFDFSVPFVVKAVMARALNVFPVEAVGGIGHEFSLLALHEPENTTDKSVTWESSDPEVATVSEDGRVSLAASGTAKITARSGEHTAECAVTVDDSIVSLTEMASTGVVINIVEDGIIVRNAPAGESIAVYTVDGKVANGAIVENEETHLTLAAGIYIVKVSPSTVAKVLIK